MQETDNLNSGCLDKNSLINVPLPTPDEHASAPLLRPASAGWSPEIVQTRNQISLVVSSLDINVVIYSL